MKLAALAPLLLASLVNSGTAASDFTRVAAFAPLTAVCFCHPSPPPYLFGPRSLVERAWTRDGAHSCRGIGGTHGAVCRYRSGSMRIVVTYGTTNQAVKFELLKAFGSSMSRTWMFLVELLPKRAHPVRCGTAGDFSRGGPAKLCLYRYAFKYSDGRLLHQGRTLVVARYIHPRAGSDFGVVVPANSDRRADPSLMRTIMVTR